MKAVILSKAPSEFLLAYMDHNVDFLAIHVIAEYGVANTTTLGAAGLVDLSTFVTFVYVFYSLWTIGVFN